MDRPELTVRVVPLASDEAGDPRMPGTGAQRVAAVAELSLEGWHLAGRVLPAYTRRNMPVVKTTLLAHAR